MAVALSTILISKNQAWNICRLIESVLQETAHIAWREVVLVDSASTDATVNLASRYPIRVLRLKADQPLSPAAGRYVGYTQTSGTWVLFLDGDQELYPGWLAQGMAAMHKHADLAAVTGPCIQLPRQAGKAAKPPRRQTPLTAPTTVSQCGGAAMFRRAVLEQVGSFNPYLCSDEEPELCLRIRHAGYRICQLAHPIAYEYTESKEIVATKIARWRRQLYLGAGQNLRYHLGDEIFWPYLRERGFGLVPLVGLLVGGAASAWYVHSGQGQWLGIWATLVGLFVIADAWRKRSLYRTCVSLVERLCIAEGMVRGFLRQVPEPHSYPSRFDVIR